MRSTQSVRPRQFAFPHSAQKVVFTPPVLELFSKYRQQGSEPEAGGLLFAEFDLPQIRIVEATPPHATDKRWRTLFVPNRALQRVHIDSCFKKHRHFVGEWHTHPESDPTPSSIDLNSMFEAFSKSQHELNYFLMVIVGNKPDGLRLWVGAHDGTNHFRLHEIIQSV